MSRSIRNPLIVAALAALPIGCTTTETPAPRQRPTMEEGVYRKSSYVEPPPGSVARDIPLYDYGAREPRFSASTQPPPGSSPPANQPPADDGTPLVDTTGIRLGELPSVRAVTVRPQHWQSVLPGIEGRIDAPDLKNNARQGMAALAPRVARALIDFKGETAIVTIAVYRDPAPATLPSTHPATALATQPAYRHAAVAIAFEGFAGQLDPSFIPRVLADQPRTPDDGREPIDFNLVLDRDATSYVFYQLSQDGLLAGQVSHADLRRDLADAADKLGPATRPSTGQAAPAAPATDSVAGIYEPLPPTGGVVYDTGEPWGAYRYGGYVYRGPDYYWGNGSDPYLYDLYGCRWGSPYWVTRSGYYYNDWYYGSGLWYGGGYYGYGGGGKKHHDHDGHHNGGGKPPVVVDRGTRGKVPWGNPPIVSATNPPTSANNGPTPLVIAAQPTGTPVRPAPSITGKPMRQPREFVGPRSAARTSSSGNDASTASFRTADGTVIVVPSKSSAAQAMESSRSDDSSSKPPMIVPSRRSSPAYVAPPGGSNPPAQRPGARGSTPSERINIAPRLGNSSGGNREFVGPRSSGSSEGGGGRNISGGNNSGGKNSGGRSGGDSASGSGGDGGGGRSGGGGGNSGGGGRNR